MAMMDDTPTNRAMGLGLRPPGAGFGGDPATRMGLGSMQPTRADTAVQGEPVARMPGLQGMNSTFQQMGLPPIPAPQAAVPARPPATVYFNPATNEMFAGDRAFKADDTVAAMEAAQMPGNTTRPEGQGWTPLPEGSFQQYIASFSERRSTGELLGRGVKNIAYGLGTLPGTAASLAGFEETGAALRAPVEAMLGESESEQLRSALIAQNSSLWEQALDAGIESIPMLIGSIAGGMGGAAMASRAGLAATGVARAGTVGAAVSNFPTHLAGMYDAAVRNQADLTDLQTKIEIFGGALASAYLDTFGIEGRLLSPVAKGAVQGAARNAVLSRLQSGVRTGLVEGLTEVGQTGLETLMFDPVVRDNLNPQDWKILAPHIAKQYGDAYMVSFLAGMGLGAITGTVLPQGAVARGGKTPLDTNKPVDLNAKATEQAAPEPVVAPMAEPVPQGLGPVVPALSPEEARLAADWQADTALGPAVPALGESEQALADQWRSTLGPMQLTPEMRVPPQARPAAATPMGSLLLTPEMRVPPRAAPSRPGQVLLTQRQRVGETPTVSMMAPVVEARPGAMLLRPEQRVLPTAPTPAPAAPTAPVTPVAPVAVAPEEAVAARRVLDSMVFIPADYEPSQSELTAKARLDRAYAAFDQKYAIRQDQVGPPHRRTPAAEWTGGDYFEAQREGTPEFKEIEAASIAYNKAAASRTDALNNLRYELSQALPERAADIAADPLTFALAAQAETTIPMVDPKFSPESRSRKGGALTKAQREAAKKAQTVAIVMDRVAALSPAQQLALMERLDVVDADGVRAAAEADPVRVAKIVDAVTMPTPPAPPAGSELRRSGARAKAASKQDTVKAPGKRTGAPRAEVAPEPVPAVEPITVTSVKRSPRGMEAHQIITLSDGRVVRIKHTGDRFKGQWTFMKTGDVIGPGRAEDVARFVADLATKGALPDAVVDTAAEVAPAVPTTKEQRAAAREIAQGYVPLDQEIDDFIAALDTATNKVDRATAISGLKDVLAEPSITAAQRARVTDYLAGLGAEMPASELAGMVGVDAAVAELALMIDGFNSAPGELTGTWQKRFRELAAEVRKSAPDARHGDRKLLSYVKANNDPVFGRVDGVRQIVSGAGAFSLADWNTISNVVDLDGKPITPIAPGRVQLLVRNFTAKLARAPKVTVVRNQADLKEKNPALYARAVAARPQGDFDTAQAMGYSFDGGEVIIFTDRIATEQQLNFVLAHESMGHYGLRAIMPGPKFDALMEQVYADSPAIKTAVDAAIASRPTLSRAEAVEEYMSDYAAVLETSIVARVWNSIKAILNKLGIQTGDEMVRYFLDQSRRYVRYGAGTTFDAQAIGQQLHNVETMGDTGRFSTGQSLREVNRIAGLMVDSIGGYPMNFEEGWQYLKRQGVNSVESWDKFKATFLSLANFRARQNPGLLALEKLLDQARNLSMSIKVDFNEKLALVLNRAIVGEVGGISDVQTARINEMLYAAQRYNVAQVQKLADLGNVPLFRMENGRLVPNQPEIDRLKALGSRTLQQMRDGFEYEVTFDEAGTAVTKTERFDGFKDLTEASIEWRGYQKIRAAMDEIELRLLRARYEGALQERDLAFRQIAATVPDGELTADERTALTELAKTYGDLYTANVQQDETGRAVLDADYQVYANDILRTANAALIGVKEDRFDALRALLVTPRQFMKGETAVVRRELPAAMEAQAADDLIARLQGFKSRMRIEGDRFVVQNKVKQVILAELANKDADKFTKRTIATGYTPILREGAYQMRVEATVGGRVVRLQDSYREQLVYSQFDTAAEAMEMADRTNGAFGDTEFEAMAYDPDYGGYRLQKVKLRAVAESALDAVAAPPQLNLNEFIRGLRQFDINLSPDKMEDVIVALTKQNSAARNRLERVFTPGAKLDGVMATMRHIESRASTISKTVVRPQLAELMDRSMSSTMALWNGDADHMEKLRLRAETAAADPNLSREAKVDAQREYEQYAYMYAQTNPGGGKPRRANQFYNEAARTVAFLDGNRNVDESDFGSGPMVSRIRAATSMMQLGGSVATGALNVLSVYTNGVPYLSSYNHKTAFGGGFSVGKVMRELHRAAAQVGGPGITSGEMNTAEFYERVANSQELQQRYKLKAHEAAFIAQEILDGAMIPAQSNALVGTARGRTTKGWQQQFLDKWMWTFNVTEQASRRSFGLTAYRLEYDRKVAAGASEADAAAAAREFAVNALQYTMGEYSVLNRPPAWRSGIQSFIYMYKVFPTTSVQMFANLSRGGKVGMIAGLWLLTGLSGLPFAEDLEDVLDTLAQRLKVPGWQGVRYESAQFIDSVFPGMSPYFLKGVVNNVIPADIAGRTSLGDLLPGTDVLLAGADVTRGVSELVGPAPSMLLGTAKFAADVIAAPFSTTTTLESVAREAPVTMLRAVADAYAYQQNGAVVDRRGYVVSPEMDSWLILTRALGFYPAAAANQYEMIRAAKRMTDFQRELVTSNRTAWVQAMMRGDRAFAKEIEDSVASWNESARGTALEIRDFTKNSQRALREAGRPAMERTLRSAPDAAGKDLQRMIDLMTLN